MANNKKNVNLKLSKTMILIEGTSFFLINRMIPLYLSHNYQNSIKIEIIKKKLIRISQVE